MGRFSHAMGKLARFSVTLRYRGISVRAIGSDYASRFKFAHAYLVYSEIYAKIAHPVKSLALSRNPARGAARHSGKRRAEMCIEETCLSPLPPSVQFSPLTIHEDRGERATTTVDGGIHRQMHRRAASHKGTSMFLSTLIRLVKLDIYHARRQLVCRELLSIPSAVREPLCHPLI